MQKLLWSVYLSFGLALFVLVNFADCPQDGGCYNCYDVLIDCATNGNRSCSSNCVKLTPAACSNFIYNVTSRLDSMKFTIYDIVESSGSANRLLVESTIPLLSNVESNLTESLTALQNFHPTNNVVEYLHRSLSQLESLLDRVDRVDEGTIANIVYSNRVTHSYTVFSGRLRVSFYCSLATNHIHHAIDNFGQIESDVINTHSAINSYLQNSLGLIQELLSDARSLTGFMQDIQQDSVTLFDQTEMLRADASAIDCEPCGRGSSSGSSGGSTDMTSIDARLAEIESKLKQLYNLIEHYYTDYNYARVRPVSQSEPSYSAYQSIGDNWFSRVEYLLYSVSPLVPSNTLEGAENPDVVEGQYEYQRNVDDLETAVTEHEQSLTSTVTQPLAALKDSFSSLWNRLSVFKIPGSNPDDPLMWSHLSILEYNSSGSSGFRLEASNSTTGTVDTFRKLQIAFRILWFLLTAALYIYFTVSIIKFSFKIGSFVVKLLNTSFGSS